MCMYLPYCTLFAFRARKRMDNEDVFGTRIKVRIASRIRLPSSGATSNSDQKNGRNHHSADSGNKHNTTSVPPAYHRLRPQCSLRKLASDPRSFRSEDNRSFRQDGSPPDVAGGFCFRPIQPSSSFLTEDQEEEGSFLEFEDSGDVSFS